MAISLIDGRTPRSCAGSGSQGIGRRVEPPAVWFISRSAFRPIPRGDRCPDHGLVRRWFRSVIREPAVVAAPWRAWRDVALVAVAEVVAVIEALLRNDLPLRWPTLAITLVVLPTLLWRRTHPLPVVAASFGTMNVLSILDLVSKSALQTGLNTMVVLLLSLYALCRWGLGRAVLLGIVIAYATRRSASLPTGPVLPMRSAA